MLLTKALILVVLAITAAQPLDYGSRGTVAATGLPASVGGADDGAQRLLRTRAGSVVSLALVPFEQRLSLGTHRLFRLVRKTNENLAKYLRMAVRRWARWAQSALLCTLFALLAPLLDLTLVRTWWKHGFRAFCASMLLALAVYIRLLLDRNSSTVGKVLLVLAIAYGVVSEDLVPDYLLPLGVIDDIVALTAASRLFTWLCPDWLVERHAVRATQTWDRLHRAAS
ncbi:MAG: YkvA family protein [Candidatus Binatia bacterium]